MITDRLYIIAPSAQQNFNTLKTDQNIYWDYKKGMELGVTIWIFNPTTNIWYETKVVDMNIGASLTEKGDCTIVNGTMTIPGKYYNFVKLQILGEVKLTHEIYSKFNLKQAASKLLKLDNSKHHFRLELVKNALPSKSTYIKSMEQLLNNNPPRKGFTYFIGEVRPGFLGFGKRIKYVKIGYTANHPKNGERLKGLKTSNLYPLKLLKYINDPDEKKYHNKFSSYRVILGGGTEWFKNKGELKKFINL